MFGMRQTLSHRL